jgi:hypothetical protein
MNVIRTKMNALKAFIETEKFSGYDPYDGLTTPLFNLPFFKSNKVFRFTFQQVIKRFPYNIRPVLGIKKGINPVTLGLSIQSYAYLTVVEPLNKELYLTQIEKLISQLQLSQSKFYAGACWGYNFDWEARYTTIKAFQPTVVATGIITNALFECWKITKNEHCKDLIISSSNFVLKDLNRTEENNTFCFSYSPFDHQKVLNASMKGSRILAQTYFLTKDETLWKPILASVQFVINNQQQNGSFTYSNKRAKIDNYHTAYILDCLDEIQKYLEISTFDEQLKRGLNYYLMNFFEENGAPKFYHNANFPIDCTSGGQSLLTLTRFNKTEQAKKTANYLLTNMQDKNGSFYFRKYHFWTVKTSFMRWSNAWMFAGLSYLLYKQKAS